MKTYYGVRRESDGACLVFVRDPHRAFPSSEVLTHVKVHSTGLEWGYGGSGPSDLALSILTDYLEEDPRRVKAYSEHGGMWGERCEPCAGEGYVEIIPAPVEGDQYALCTHCQGLGYLPNPESKAWRWHHEFLRQYVGQLDRWKWTISATEIAVFVEQMKRADALVERSPTQ